MKRFTLLFILLSLCIFSFAQSMSVKSFKALTTDMTASSINGKRIDQNGEVAALIKIETSQTGFIFEGGTLGIVDTKQETGEIWVWVPRGLRKITIKHQQLGILRDYIFPVPIEAERTYQMVLTTDQIETIVKPSLHQQYLVFQITPSNATLEVDEQIWEVDPDGSSMKYVNFGTYNYRVQAPNYHIDAGKTVVDDPDNAKVVTINLLPNFGWIEVPGQGNLQGASVYVDNVIIGKTPCKSDALKSGQHTVRIVKDMYESHSETVTVKDNETTTVSPTLKANFAEVTLKVDADAEIWVNNERKGVRSWTGPLGSGTYRVECKMPNHEPSVTSQNITADMKGQTITLPLPKPIFGAVSIESTPNLCDIVIDGNNMGVTPKFIPELLIGKHELTLSKKGYMSSTTTFTLTEGERKELKLKLGTEPTDKLIKKGDNYRNKKQYAEAIRCFQDAISLGDLEAQQRLGIIYEYGYGVEKDVKEALRLYTEAAQQGNPVAQNTLGGIYADGHLVTMDKAEAVKWYRMAAEQGNANAQFNLAECYKKGTGVTINLDEANRWYQASAESHRKKAKQGDASAMEMLAYYYQRGLGVKRNNQESDHWYQAALEAYKKEAEEGFVYSQNKVGNFYYYGNGVKKNYSEALKWYSEAAEQGYTAAYSSLGWIYYNGGHGVQQDFQKAFQWFSKSADDGSWTSMERVAEFYKDGKGVAKDTVKSQQYYNKAMEELLQGAELGRTYSMEYIGDRYRDGKGVKKDVATAMQWYQKALEAGNDDVLYNIGYMYERDKDYKEAMKWYRLGTDKNNASCQRSLGSMYYLGNGVSVDYSEAIKWFKKAAENGNDYAIKQMGDVYHKQKKDAEALKYYQEYYDWNPQYGAQYIAALYKDQKNYDEALKWYKKYYDDGNDYALTEIGDMYREQQKYDEAMKWYRKGADKNNPSCQMKLGGMYERGEGVPVNEQEALKWYRKAYDQGYTFLQSRIDNLSK